MIPYYSHISGKHEGFYSLYLLMRAIGYIVGSFSVKIIGEYVTFHQGIMIGYCLAGFAFIIFDEFDPTYLKSIAFLIAFLGTALFDIFSQLPTTVCYRGRTIESALLIQLACIGPGAIVTPFLIDIFDVHTYTFLGFFCFLMMIFSKFLKSPDQNF